MAIDVHDLRMVMSGGAANTTPSLSIGGAISTAGGGVIDSQTVTQPVNITGVTINDAFGNNIGVGSLRYQWTPTKRFAWRPYGAGAYSADKTVGSDGTYTVGSSNGYVEITVTYASLATADKNDSITIGNNPGNLFDTVTAAQALTGKTSYRCFYIKNVHATDTAIGVKLWVKQITPAEDNIYIGLDPAGINGTATTPGNEITAPAGVSFSQPLSQAGGLALPVDGNLDATEYIAVWLRRTVPVESRGTYIGNTFVLAVSADI